MILGDGYLFMDKSRKNHVQLSKRYLEWTWTSNQDTKPW